MSFANEKAYHAIECHVSQCNNHCGCEDYCTLCLLYTSIFV